MTQLVAGSSVLLVEDEALIAMMIEDMILELGCILQATASNVREALRLLETGRPDIALLDVNLGGDLVYPVCERLAELGIPFVFSTGYGLPGVPEQWRECQVLQKPYGAAQLAAALGQGLG